jgi:hypothetical protein
MNPVELRYALYKSLLDMKGVDVAGLVSPTPGAPLEIKVASDGPDGKSRYFTITLAED